MSKYVPPHKKTMASDASDRFPSNEDNPFNRSFNGRFSKRDQDRDQGSQGSYRSYDKSYNGLYSNRGKQDKQNVDSFSTKHVNTPEDFPCLSKPKMTRAVTDGTDTAPAPAPVSNRPTFAQLASEWTKKLQDLQLKEAEELKVAEEKAKKLKELKDKEERDRLKVRSFNVILNKKHGSDDEKEFDIGCHVSDGSEEEYNSQDEPPCEEDDYEEEEEDEDEYWENKKNRNELSTF